MMMPTRIQLKRARGFNLQEASRAANGLPAVKVDRSTGFGSPFPVAKGTSTTMGKTTEVWSVGTWEGPAMWFKETQADAVALSVDAFRAWITQPAQQKILTRAKTALRGKNLACWCKGSPCHADVLLELANPPIKCEDADTA